MYYNEIPSQYNPKTVEDKWYKFWEENNLFCAKINPAKKPFTIAIPPPNVTGILHMGHALNNTIQDILIRYHRMKGEEALWMSGTDHAGIATQNVVEKVLAKEGLKRHDLGREKFIQRVWAWKEQYGSTIIRQLKKLGASCDWQRLRFTMDEEYSKTVTDVFVELYEKGLIYQGSYIINWCPRCQTALSDEEAPHQALKGSLYYIKYPLKNVTSHTLTGTGKSYPYGHRQVTGKKNKNCGYVVVATTRPETMLGDTAVAVNPKDKRYKKLIGETLILPLVNREIKIIADEMVDVEFGTGAVKVTPAHDPNDYSMGKKHKLEFINVLHPDGRMNALAAGYKDMDRFKAREAIINDLKEISLLEKIEPHKISAGHCYRCHTIIEPYLSKQWFVKMAPLAVSAIGAVKKGKIKFYPERWTKVYLNWMENIHDWCISRQIWWGHRIPVYYCKACQASGGVIVSKNKPDKCPDCGLRDIYQDEDVLDTWFSSWLWPFATFKDKAELKYFYPTSVLVTAPEIIFFWVARMIMAGFKFMGDIPFKDVYIHGTVRDIEGKKMSKSMGNVIDPLEVINEYGSDALRFSLISITSQGQDVFLSKERFEQGRNFANKIWNASRFILMNLKLENTNADLCVFFKKENLSLVNRWILSRFYSILKQVNKSLDTYKFNEAANLLYSFFWHEFCDWYLELVKQDIDNPHNQLVMSEVLEKFLRLAHPFMPFITEEIWQLVSSQGRGEQGSIMLEAWPHIQEQIIDKKTEDAVGFIFEVITAIRNTRLELEIPAGDNIELRIASADKASRSVLELMSGHIQALAKIDRLEISAAEALGTVPAQGLANRYIFVLKDTQITIFFSADFDMARYEVKLNQKITGAVLGIKNKAAMLSNKAFLERAPKEILEKEKLKLSELQGALKKLESLKDGLIGYKKRG